MPRDRTKSTLQKVSRDDWNSRQSEGFTRWVSGRAFDGRAADELRT